MLVSTEDGWYLSSRAHPRAVLIVLDFNPDSGKYTLHSAEPGDERRMEFSLPEDKSAAGGVRSVGLWDVHVDNVIDCGDEAANFVSEVVLGKVHGARLVYHLR